MKRAVVILLIIAAIGVGAGAYYIRRGAPDVAVSTVSISRGDIVDAVAATGTLQAVISVTVGSQVSGNIAWLGADYNSIVKKNQVIAKLDPTLFEAAVAQATAQLGQQTANLANAKAQLIKDTASASYAKVSYQRTADLSKQQLVSQDQLDQAKAAADQATAVLELDKASIQQVQAAVAQSQAQLSTAQTNLKYTVITSPIDGIVTQRSVDVGQTVAASMTAPTLFVIAQDLTQLLVSANIDESDVGRISPGQDVVFRVDAFPGQDYHGTVGQIRLNPTIVNNVTVYATIINVPNEELRLKPGMTANLKVQVAKKASALRVTNAALRFRPSLDVFAALNEPVPPEALGRGGRGGAGRGGAGRGAAGGAGAAANGGGGRAAGNGRGQRGGDGAGTAADRQERQLERFKALSPDDQRQFVARLVGRGQDATAFQKLLDQSGDAKAPALGFVYQPRYGDKQDSPTIARLFAATPEVDTTGRIWIYVDHQLKPVTVRLGITDGTFTELLSNDLPETTQVVTGVTGLGAARPQAAAATGNPFQANQQRGGGPGRGF